MVFRLFKRLVPEFTQSFLMNDNGKLVRVVVYKDDFTGRYDTMFVRPSKGLIEHATCKNSLCVHNDKRCNVCYNFEFKCEFKIK